MVLVLLVHTANFGFYNKLAVSQKQLNFSVHA